MHPTPRVIDDELVNAWRVAKDEIEPVFVPAQIFADDRGWSITNQLKGVLSAKGQVNYSLLYPGVIKAWHRHKLQTDFWLGIDGHLKVGMHREQDGQTWMAVVGEKRPGVLIIPPPLWHGATVVGPASAGLFYYVTHAYNHAAPDEERRAHDSITDFDWGMSHR